MGFVYGCVGPTAPPSSFTADEVNARNATLTWTAPEERGQNGIITGYTVSCSDGTRIITFQVSVILMSLTPYLYYTCSVSASNSAGSSPEATVNFTTSTDGKLNKCVLIIAVEFILHSLCQLNLCSLNSASFLLFHITFDLSVKVERANSFTFYFFSSR